MSYTDMSSWASYKKLISHTDMDKLGENDKVFNDLLTATTDFNNHLRFNNTKGITGEIAAGSTYKNLIQLDASNIVQLAESGTEVRVPADPTNALGVATKQYVDAVQMLQTQAVATGSPGNGALATILSLSATTRGQVHAIWYANGAGGTNAIRVKITIDGTVVVDETSPQTVTASFFLSLEPNTRWPDSVGQSAEGTTTRLINLRFNSTLLIEASKSENTGTLKVLYSKIP